MRPTLYYEIKASREFPMRSELTRLVRCTREYASEGVGKWLIEIFEFPMDGIVDTTFVHDTPLASRQIGRAVCGKVLCALSFGSRIEWSAEYRQITMEEALDLLDLIKGRDDAD